jgi:hypothetical protein
MLLCRELNVNLTRNNTCFSCHQISSLFLEIFVDFIVTSSSVIPQKCGILKQVASLQMFKNHVCGTECHYTSLSFKRHFPCLLFYINRVFQLWKLNLPHLMKIVHLFQKLLGRADIQEEDTKAVLFQSKSLGYVISFHVRPF